VRRPAPAGHVEVQGGMQTRLRNIDITRVDEQHRRRPGKRTPPGEHDLASAGLLGGTAHHPHPTTEPGREGRQRPPGTDAGRGNQIVSAGVPQSRQGVVLTTDRHHRSVRAGRGDKRRRYPERRAPNRQTGANGDASAGPHRSALMPGQLRMAMQLVGQRGEPAGVTVDRRADGVTPPVRGGHLRLPATCRSRPPAPRHEPERSGPKNLGSLRAGPRSGRRLPSGRDPVRHLVLPLPPIGERTPRLTSSIMCSRLCS
jgi:hypothetical protein